MQRTSSFVAAALLVLSPGAFATAAGAGADWDDSHMRSRHETLRAGTGRPKLVLGNDRFHQVSEDPAEAPAERPPETLGSFTQRSWAAGGRQSISFGAPDPRRFGSSVPKLGRTSTLGRRSASPGSSNRGNSASTLRFGSVSRGGSR